MPGRSTLPEPSGQPSWSTSRRWSTTCRLRLAKSYISSRKPSSPVQRQMSATALGNLIVSSRVEVVRLRAVGRGRLRVVAEPDRAVRDRLVHDDPRAVVEDVGDVAQRAQVVLGHVELAERHGREVRVLAVGGEDPRVVGEAGAEPARVGDRPERRRELLALVRPADLQVRRGLRQVGQVLLAPVDRRSAAARSPGSETCDHCRRACRAGAPLAASAPAGSSERRVQLAAARRRGPCRSRPPRPRGSCARRPGRSPGSAARRRCPCRTARRRTRSAATRRRRRRRPAPAAARGSAAAGRRLAGGRVPVGGRRARRSGARARRAARRRR